MTSDRASLDRSRPPAGGEVKGFRFPEFVHTRLAGGPELYLARWPYYPLVSVQLLMPAGGQYQEPGQAGLASLQGALLDEGTATRSALEIATSIEQVGGFLGTGADWDVSYVSATVLAPHLEAGLELAADVARRPSFPADEVERVRRQRLAEILRAKGQPAALADRYFSRAVYSGTPFAEPLMGTEESVRAFDRELSAGFHRRHASPAGSALVAIGDLDPGDLARRLEAAFGDWEGAAAPGRPEIEPRALEGVEIHVVDRPGSTQTQLKLGHAGIARDDPDHPKALVANAILGGKFTSRLNLNLREKHGITYGAHSQFVYRQAVGPFSIRMAVATEATGTALREILFEMRRMREDLVSEEDLVETQDFMMGVFPITIQTVSDLAKRLETLALFGLPDDYYAGYPKVLGELGREDVREASRRYFHPDALAVVAVGPAEELRAQLESFGPVTVWKP